MQVILLKIRIVSLLISMLLVWVAPSVHADGKVYRWRLAETWAPNFPIFGDATKDFAKMVKVMSGGRLLIRVDSANKHKAPLGIFDFVRTGQYQMGHSASYYWKGKDFNTQFFTAVPFGMMASEKQAWFYHGEGMSLMEEVYKPYGILSFPAGSTGNQMGGWFRKEINSLEDLKGLKMRIPGFAGEIMAEVGAKPVNIAQGELYTALERNTIDALEWVGPSLDLRMGFQKIAPYFYNGWHEPGTEMQFMVNKKAFDALPEDLRAILVNAMRLTAYDMTTRFTYESAINLDRIEKDYANVKIKQFPPEVMQALKQTKDKLMQKYAAEDELTARIIESMTSFGNKARKWTNFSERSYLDSLDSLANANNAAEVSE